MFVHLNTHSYYSLGWGTESQEKICQTAKESGCDTLAITDTNNLYGLFFFLQYAREAGVRPIVGSEITSLDGKTRAVVLVKNSRGYVNLCQMITDRQTDPNFDLHGALLEKHDGLTIMTANASLLNELHGITPDLYAELVKGMPVRELIRTARYLGIKPVATARSFWIDRLDSGLHCLLRAIHLNKTLSDLTHEDCASPDARMLSGSEMKDYFSFCPEAIDNTREVAELCTWTPDFGIVYPELEPGMNGHSIILLREKAYEGAVLRYGQVNDKIRDRIEHELKLIDLKGFAPVFLIVEDIVHQTSLTCGRGSAAASIVSYCLGITHVDPIRHNLFFERFINTARREPPDIDVDFAWDERDDVLDYVFNRYGVDNSAMVANHVTFKKRATIHETAKVYGLPEAEITAVTKRMSHGYSFSGNKITDHPALKDHGFPAPWSEILSWADRLEGIPRHLSVHCGGVVITPGKTANWVPTEVAAKGVKIIHWEKDQTEESGLVKIDILGNRSLAVIRDAIAMIKEHYDIDLDYSSLNVLDDPATQQLIARGETMGVFYVESPATRQLQKKAGMGDYEHLVLHSSIIRPAANPYIQKYLRRLKGEPWEPLHPLIGNLLDDTYGIMVYQEDVTRVAMHLAGFDIAEADELRKIISKKHKQRRLADLKLKFFDGASARGVSKDIISEIWGMIMSFAGYSFCKPHSASYALVSFKSAYIRAHYPAEFIAAVISNRGGFYSTFAYVSEAKRMGLSVLPPDVNESEIKYTGRDDWLRIGLMQIKGLPTECMNRIVDGRNERTFSDFDDLRKRAELTQAEARLLVKSGCCDRLEPERTRPELLSRLLMEPHSKPVFGQGELFEMSSPPSPKRPEYDDNTLLQHEVETLGFLASRHPLDLYRDRIAQRPAVPATDLENHIGRRIEVIGWLVTGKVVISKKRELMEFITFEDTTGLIETTFFPEAFRHFGHIISRTHPYRLFGKIEENFGAVTMTVDRVEFL